MRIAVLGLFNSGSTLVAGMLHRLGVNMGAPYWQESNPTSRLNYYEPYDLSWHLRHWWNEPSLTELITARERIEILRNWVALQEAIRGPFVGAKHPLLSLCAMDILEAWGRPTILLWAYRSLEDSINGLKRRGWFPNQEERVQTRIWEALQDLASTRAVLTKIDFSEIRRDPKWAAQTLAAIAKLSPSPKQLHDAESFVRSARGS